MNCFQLIAFSTDLGWTGLLLDGGKISRIKFGFQSEINVLRSFSEAFNVRGAKGFEKTWVTRLQKYAEGKNIDLGSIPVDFSGYTVFQAKVLRQCRRIPFGKTISYGKLAAKSKAPRAARAVGTTMKKNKFPLVIPCHRVVSSNGLGGYSAADGVSVKRKLLALEGCNF